MGIPLKRIRTLCGLAALLGLSNCATTQETRQECGKAAYAFCDRKVAASDSGSRGSGAADGAARNAAHQQCLDTQLAACGAP